MYIVLEWKQLRIRRSKGRLHGGGVLICVIRTCKACSIGAHYDVHLLLHHVLTSHPLGFLTDIVAEA